MSFKLLKSVREYKKYVFITPILVIFEVLFEILIPYNMATLIDDGVLKSDTNVIYSVGIKIFIYAIVALLCGVIAGKTATVASAGYIKNLRSDLYSKVTKFSFSNIDKFSSASLITRIVTDTNMIQNAFNMTFRLLIRTPLMIVMSVILIIKINTLIAMVFVALMPFLVVIFLFITRLAYSRFIKVMTAVDDLNQTVSENVNSQRVVKSFVREEYEITKFNQKAELLYRLNVRARRVAQLLNPLLDFSIYCVIVLVLIIGSQKIILGSMSTGELATIITYSIQIMVSMLMLGIIFIFNIIAKPSVTRVKEVLDEEADIKNPINPIMDVKSGDISFNNVKFAYKGNRDFILKDINLDIKQGEFVGILGATGAAKSSLVQLIPRLYDTTEGEVFVGDENVKDYDLAVLRDSVAMVLQNNQLFSGTIKQNLLWGNEKATQEEIEDACKNACADKFIEEFPQKYETMLTQGATNLSGGQKQRICIARALLKKPKVIIMDDSTSAVDTKTEKMIQNVFTQGLSGVTKIVIAQRISSVVNADKIVVIDKGRIVDVGKSEELAERCEIYKEIYESQVKGVINE